MGNSDTMEKKSARRLKILRAFGTLTMFVIFYRLMYVSMILSAAFARSEFTNDALFFAVGIVWIAAAEILIFGVLISLGKVEVLP